MKNLLYCMFTPGIFSAEITYSLHSAYRFLPPSRSDYRFLIYCVDPSYFAGLRADLIPYDPEQIKEWAGPHNFFWRIKIKTLMDALQRYNEPTILLDGDTYFRKSPDRLFERLRPGHSLLHIREGRVHELNDQVHRDLRALLLQQTVLDPATGASIPPTQAMWNAGTVGLHPSDLPVLQHAIDLTDRIVAEDHIFTAEQFSLSYCMETQTRLHAADDIVFHYWNMRYRRPFRAILDDLLRASRGLAEAERVKRFYRIRPRATRRKRVANRIIRTFDRIGITLLPHDPRQSG